jgi:hypothetical protein
LYKTYELDSAAAPADNQRPESPEKDRMAYVLNKTRADDEQTLDMLRRRDLGQSVAAIGRAHGLSKTAVAHRISRIRADDMAHDPEAAAYWRP